MTITTLNYHIPFVNKQNNNDINDKNYNDSLNQINQLYYNDTSISFTHFITKSQNIKDKNWIDLYKIPKEFINLHKSIIIMKIYDQKKHIEPDIRNYNDFFNCECLDKNNHILDNCEHYKLEQYEKLLKDELIVNGKRIQKNMKNYSMISKKYKKQYKPQYDIYYWININSIKLKKHIENIKLEIYKNQPLKRQEEELQNQIDNIKKNISELQKQKKN